MDHSYSEEEEIFITNTSICFEQLNQTIIDNYGYCLSRIRSNKNLITRIMNHYNDYFFKISTNMLKDYFFLISDGKYSSKERSTLIKKSWDAIFRSIYDNETQTNLNKICDFLPCFFSYFIYNCFLALWEDNSNSHGFSLEIDQNTVFCHKIPDICSILGRIHQLINGYIPNSGYFADRMLLYFDMTIPNGDSIKINEKSDRQAKEVVLKVKTNRNIAQPASESQKIREIISQSRRNDVDLLLRKIENDTALKRTALLRRLEYDKHLIVDKYDTVMNSDKVDQDTFIKELRQNQQKGLYSEDPQITLELLKKAPFKEIEKEFESQELCYDANMVVESVLKQIDLKERQESISEEHLTPDDRYELFDPQKTIEKVYKIGK